MLHRSALAFCLLLTGCSALEAAAPVAFAATEALIRQRIGQAPALQAEQLAEALVLLEQARAAKEAAEKAQHAADAAAQEAKDAAAVAKAHAQSAEANAAAARLERMLAEKIGTALAVKIAGPSPAALAPQ